ncbi:hypothetical protein Q3G72_018507 [Acer saccharum]|nr:hypothetical protein Q3G72_018507 [Acer saccharum]
MPLRRASSGCHDSQPPASNAPLPVEEGDQAYSVVSSSPIRVTFRLSIPISRPIQVVRGSGSSDVFQTFESACSSLYFDVAICCPHPKFFSFGVLPSSMERLILSAGARFARVKVPVKTLATSSSGSFSLAAVSSGSLRAPGLCC